MEPTRPLSTTTKGIGVAVIVLSALLLLVGGWAIPYYYESFSILYKFGIEKTYLRSGKMVGISLVVLVLFQLVLAARLTLIERIFSVKKAFSLHRINGTIIALLIFLHPLLIKASENFTSYTWEKKYYPEFLGIGLFSILLAVSATAIFRAFLKIPYTSWLQQHRLAATLALVILPTHVLWVSDTFKSGVPRTAALVVFCLYLLLIAKVWLRRLALEKK